MNSEILRAKTLRMTLVLGHENKNNLFRKKIKKYVDKVKEAAYNLIKMINCV